MQARANFISKKVHFSICIRKFSIFNFQFSIKISNFVPKLEENAQIGISVGNGGGFGSMWQSGYSQTLRVLSDSDTRYGL
jgi:hypothetical protein